MILLLSIATIIVILKLDSLPLITQYDWLDVIDRYENELAIIVFAISLLCYMSIVSLRFFSSYSGRPNQQDTIPVKVKASNTEVFLNEPMLGNIQPRSR